MAAGPPRHLDALLDRAQARARIASTLQDVLADVIDPALLDRGCPDRQAIEAILVPTLASATSAALTALADGVEPAFAACDETDLERLAMGRRWRELGWE
jgi:hypothetical protein